MKRLDGQLGKATATASDSPGFVKVANVHHFANEGTNKQHLWMATAIDDFVKIPRADFDRAVDQSISEKFTHLRVTIAKDADLAKRRNGFGPSTQRAWSPMWCWRTFLPIEGIGNGTSRTSRHASPL